jgi:glycosyltransferase involved in cell wall biosynthesis
MIGDGPQFSEVKSHLQRYHLDGRVRLTGWISQEGVNLALSQSDLLLMPSLRESMPLVGLQALAAGVGLILSDVGACAEMVVEGRNGFLLPVNDIFGFSRTLRSLLSTTEIITELKKVSKKKSAAFNLHAILDQYRSIYQEISGI